MMQESAAQHDPLKGETSPGGHAPIAIVGIGCLFPKADGVEAFWSNIKRGVDAITPVPDTHWKPDQYFDGDPSKPDMTYARRGGFIDPVDFNPLHHGIAPNNIEATDTTQLLGLIVAEQALRDAGYETGRGLGDGRAFDRDRTSVILGVTGTLELVIPLGARLGHPIWRKALDEAGVDKATADDVVERIADGYVPWQENSFPGLLGNVAAGRIANRFDLGGSNCVVDAACASSLSAVHMAAMELQTGRADMVLTGGLDTFNDIFMYMCFSKTPALSPTGDAKPFSADGDGTILGEGLGIVVLKRLADAERDGDRIYAVIKGIGSSSDGKGNAIYAPSAAGQVKCLTNAYREAGVSPRTIELVEAHGTGTKVGDATEIKALREVYEAASPPLPPRERSARLGEPGEGEAPSQQKALTSTGDSSRMIDSPSPQPSPSEGEGAGTPNPELETPNSPPAPWLAVGSVKSMIGHTKAAAGVAGLIKAALAIDRKVLPPTIKVSRPVDVANPCDSPVFLNTERRPWLPRKSHPRRAGVSAFGFGGSNFHCVLEEHQPAGAYRPDESQRKQAIDFSGNVAIAPFSADSSDALRRELEAFAPLHAKTWIDIRTRTASLRAAFDPAKAHRLVLVIERDRTDVAKLIASATHLLDSAARHGPARAASSPDGAYYATGQPAKLAFLFPGQGSQYVGMLRDLACDAPQVLASLAAGNDAFGENDRGERLSDRIYPVPVFDDASREANEAALRDTRIAQPALGAVSVGALRVLEHFGLRPDATAGHSFGELVALHAAGRIDEATLHALAGLRGRLMAEAGGDRADRGAMLAVSAPVAEVEQLLGATNIDAVVANLNAPQQVVLSGSTAAIDQAAAACVKHGLRAKKLPVAAAFHSAFVADAEPRFAAALRDLSLTPAAIPVFANTTANVYPVDADASRHLLAGQLARPVDFTGMIERMYAAGSRTFIEVGPKATLTGLVKSILGDRGHVAISIDASAGKRSGEFDLAAVLAQTAALGHAVDLKAWDARFKPTDASPPAGRKPVMTVRLSGANYVKPRPARPRRQAADKPLDGGAPALSTPSAPPHASAPAARAPAPSDLPARPVAPAPLLSAQLAPTIKSAASQPRPPHPAQQPQPSASPLPPSPLTRPNPLNSHSPHSPLLAQALQVTQQNILALQRTQEQLAQLHRQYLTGQDAAQRTLTQLIEQQSQLLATTLGLPAPLASPAAPIAPPTLAPPRAFAPPSFIAQPIAYSSVIPRNPPPPVSTDTQVAPRSTGVAAPEVTNQSPAPTPTAAIAAPPTITGPARPGSQDDRARAALLAVVSDKTGYPVEMLDLSMSLDADLGIDSIKRVEILSALQERLPDAPVVKPEDLGTLRTLGQIVAFLGGGRRDASAAAMHVTVSQHPEALEIGARTPNPEPQTSSAESVLLAVVADKTGYPAEMLELDMSLDADLGIDSIKRVEILSALQERLPDAPVVKPEDLGTLQTLRQIVAFLAGGHAEPALAGAGGGAVDKKKVDNQPQQASATASASPAAALVRQVPTLEPITSAALRKRLRLAAHTPVWITDDGDGLASHLRASLIELGIEAAVVPLNADPTDKLLAGLIVLTPPKPGDDFVPAAFKLMQRAGASLRKCHADTGHHVLLAAVTRLGGGFALGVADASIEPISAALAGIVKTASHEWPQVSCKVVDLGRPLRHKSELSEDLADELLREGPLEVAMNAAGRQTVALHHQPVPAAASTPLSEGDIVVITGGARGVTAEVAVALAQHYRPTLLLLGRSAAPADEPAWLHGLSDDGAMKKAIAARLTAATPKAIEQEYRSTLANREVAATMRRIEAAGGKAIYRSVDVRDAAAIKGAIDGVRSLGPIRGIIHGAGVLADRLIDDKTEEQFTLVFGTKVDGFRALLDATTTDDLRMIVTFSSSTARFGRRGQVDYAAANEVLNKLAQQQAAQRPGCRVVSVNWGPWDGGMVTPALKKLFESEGVGVIDLEAGADYLAREIATAPGGPVEVVILGAGTRTSADPAGHRSTDDHASSTPATALVDASPALRLAFEREVSVDAIPILRSHVLSGKAVLPMAVMMEWIAYGAMHDNPGLALHGLEDLRVFKGIRVDADKAVNVRVFAGAMVSDGDMHRVVVELRAGGTIHARAAVVLAAQLPKGLPAITLSLPPAPSKAVAAAYESGTLFHGPELYALRAITGCAATGASAEANAATPPAAWMKQPIRSAWLGDPLAMDAAFQLMIVWSTQQRGAPSLPTGLGRYTQFVRRFPTDGTLLAAKITRATDHEAVADIEFVDRAGNLLARIDGYTCVIDASLRDAFRLNQLAASAAV